MPNLDNYPPDWPAIATAVKDANDWCCQSCGRQCTRPGEPYAGTEQMLTVAHLDPYSYDREVVTVACLCTLCHLRYDAEYSHIFRRRYALMRQRQAGQTVMPWAVT